MVTERTKHPRDVLVVDDDLDLCEVLGCTLQRHGHRVDVAGNGALAVMRASVRRPDVVVFDLAMPGADGAMLLEQFRRRFSPVPISIAMSGTVSAAAWCTQAQVALFLVKPFTPATLQRAIELATHESEDGTKRNECVLAVGDAFQSDRFAELVDLERAAVIVLESDRDALRALESVKPRFVVVSDVSTHVSLCAAARSKGIPLRCTDDAPV